MTTRKRRWVVGCAPGRLSPDAERVEVDNPYTLLLDRGGGIGHGPDASGEGEQQDIADIANPGRSRAFAAAGVATAIAVGVYFAFRYFA